MSSTLSMFGHIDDVFKSVPATRTVTGGSSVDGIWVPGTPVTVDHIVNIQPVTQGREIDFLRNAGERIEDSRVIHLNDVNMQGVNQIGTWNFLGQSWKTVICDNRYWNDFCRLVVVRIDDQ
ncbi:MAG: hypothetical protein ACREA9_27465 [Pyrinomonadaceae bacterium]